MDNETIIGHAKRLIERLGRITTAHSAGWTPNSPSVEGVQAQIVEFLKSFAGPKSSFVKAAEKAEGADSYRANTLTAILESFMDDVETGLTTGISPQRQAQLDLVTDLLTQSHDLLNDSKVHPAAPTVLIGASLEEFLRTWLEAEGLSLGQRKPGLHNYATILREEDLLTKQDVKDIESWGGLRNHAAHGEWDDVADAKRIRLMLEGVNLFMRKYSPRSRAG